MANNFDFWLGFFGGAWSVSLVFGVFWAVNRSREPDFYDEAANDDVRAI